MSWHKARYFVEYVSDRYDGQAYDMEKDDYGSFNHYYPTHANSIKTAKGYIRKIRKECADENPRNFRIYDMWADVPQDEPALVVYQED